MISPRLIAAAIALATVTAAAAPAFAYESAIEAEFQAQHDRIERGIRSGAITRREAIELRSEQDRIARMIARARFDGRVDPYERREIEQAQAIASRQIYAEKHDADVAGPVVRHGYGFWHRPRWY